MNHTQEQLDEAWDALKKPENATKSIEAENANIPAPKIVVDDDVEQVISLPTHEGTERDDYVRRPGGPWTLVP